jgi:hypothetical protein
MVGRTGWDLLVYVGSFLLDLAVAVVLIPHMTCVARPSRRRRPWWSRTRCACSSSGSSAQPSSRSTVGTLARPARRVAALAALRPTACCATRCGRWTWWGPPSRVLPSTRGSSLAAGMTPDERSAAFRVLARLR